MTELSNSQRDGSGELLQGEDMNDNLVHSDFKRAKEFMKTPCGHRYHPPCLIKWMEVKHECPFCRQAIPVIEE